MLGHGFGMQALMRWPGTSTGGEVTAPTLADIEPYRINATRWANIPYADDAEWVEGADTLHQRFDINIPATAPPPAGYPVIIYWHPNGSTKTVVGGSVVDVQKQAALAAGFAFASVDFRHPVVNVSLGAPHTDCGLSIQGVRALASALSLDLANVFGMAKSRGSLCLWQSLQQDMLDALAPTWAGRQSSLLKAIWTHAAQTTYNTEEFANLFIVAGAQRDAFLAANPNDPRWGSAMQSVPLAPWVPWLTIRHADAYPVGQVNANQVNEHYSGFGSAMRDVYIANGFASKVSAQDLIADADAYSGMVPWFTGLLGAETWASLGKLMINVAPPDDFLGPIYRNLAHQPRAQSSTFYGDTTDVTLKTSGADKGYPVAGTTFGSVYLSQLTPDRAGVYNLSVQGNHPFVNKGNGSLSGSTYNAGTNRTTATLTMTAPFDSGDVVALGWNSIGADFGDLQVMQPGYSVGDTNLLTTEAQEHYARFPVLRFMDRQNTNNEWGTSTWSGSKAEGGDDFDRYPRSIKAAFDVADACNAEAWINIPPFADANFALQAATYCGTRVAAGKFATVEWCNEPWNYNFPAHGEIVNAVLDAAQMSTGSSGSYANVRSDRSITAVSRDAAGIVSITLNHDPLALNPSLVVGSQIYDHSDANGSIAPGLVTLTEITNLGGGSWRVRYQHGTHAVTAGDPGQTVFGGYIYWNPANELVAPTTVVTFFDDPRPNVRQVKAKWEMREGLRKLYDAAVSAGVQDKVRIVKGIQLDGGESWYNERHGLAFALEKYGSLSWLFANGGGLRPAIYLQPRPGQQAAFATADDVFTELEVVRGNQQQWIIWWSNMLATFGQDALATYEGGPHTDADNGNATIKAAIRAAHLDARMGTLMQNLYQDWANRARGGICYYYGGTTRSFTGGLSTWPLIEGELVADADQPKNAAMSTIANTLFAAVEVAGVNSGTIRVADVMAPFGGWSTPGNGLFAFGSDAGLPANGFTVERWFPADGDYSIAVHAGSTDNTDQIRLFVDGTQQGAAAALPAYAGDSTVPAAALTRTVTLAKGWHRLSARFDADRQGYSGMASFVTSAA